VVKFTLQLTIACSSPVVALRLIGTFLTTYISHGSVAARDILLQMSCFECVDEFTNRSISGKYM